MASDELELLESVSTTCTGLGFLPPNGWYFKAAPFVNLASLLRPLAVELVAIAVLDDNAVDVLVVVLVGLANNRDHHEIDSFFLLSPPLELA